MKRGTTIVMCMLGVAACGGEEKPAQSPMATTTTTSTTETTASPQPVTPAPMATTPSPSSTMGNDMSPPRTYTPDTTGTPGALDQSGTTGTTGATGLPGPTTTIPSSDADKDGKKNVTPTDQGGGSDRNITASIRRTLVADKSLSATAKNVKIVTSGGKVTLRGNVKSDDEKSAIESAAKATPGVTDVDNKLDVKK